MDSDVARLVREERLLEAAKLASDRGDPRNASLIYERACDWVHAAAEALRAGEAQRALDLAVYAGDEANAERAIAVIALDAAAARIAASHLARRGQDAWAARILETCDQDVDAAKAWERANEPARAAALFERAGEPAEAARVFDAALRRDPENWKVSVRLGALLVRLGKWEAAIRVLQRVPTGAPERGEALEHIIPAFEQTGLAHAARDAAMQLESLGRPAAAPSEPERDPAPVHRPRLFGRYDVVREVASSPSSRVLECMDVVRDERVAIKMFAAWGTRGSGRDALARFEREVRAMRSLRHPGVVPLYDFVPEGPAIVLGWMAGGTLEQMLAAPDAIAPVRAVEIATAVLAALSAAHRMGIVHRDVKPPNVLFDETGGARLGDFGVAHLGDATTTATAGVFGTFAYMSPEQREGRPATARSDVFSVGVMLREMLTRERPSPDRAPRLQPSRAHPGLDARHDQAVARLMARNPDDRPADTFEAMSILASLPWPGFAEAASEPQPPVSTADGEAREGRLEAGPRPFDRWLGRDIERVPLTAAALARARAFAKADHPALQTVWRVDEAIGEIWLEALHGETLDRSLAPSERNRLGEALDALHAAGGVYGRVDPEHVVVREAGAVLRFVAEDEGGSTAERDRAALSKL